VDEEGPTRAAGEIQRAFSLWPHSNPGASIDSRLMARALGGVYISGAALALIWTVLPSPAQSDRPVVALLALVAALVGATLLSGLLDRQPRELFEIAVAIATLLISLADYFARVRGTGLTYLYLWCTPYAFWFFPRGRALLQAALVVVGYAAAAFAASHAHPGLAGTSSSDWGGILLLAGTVLVVGELVRRLGLTIDESHQRFARVFDEAPTPMARLGPDGHVIDANRAFCIAMGRDRASVLASTVRDLVPEEQLPMLLESRRRLFSAATHADQLELDSVRPDGSRVSLLLNVSMLGEIGRSGAEMFVQALDLTERKVAEDALAASERRYRALVETSQAVVWSSDRRGRFTFINDAVRSTLGYEPEELIGRPIVDVLPEELRDQIQEIFSDVFETGAGAGESVYVRRDGARIVGSYSTVEQRDEAGRLTGFAGTVLDITERKLAEEALRVSEARLRALIDNAPAAITIRDAGGRLTTVNREAARLMGGDPDTVLGNGYAQMHRRAEAEELRLIDRSVLERGEPSFYEQTLTLSDGEHIFLAVVFPLPAVAGEPALICRIAFDITDRERARLELIRSNEERRRLLAELVRAQEDERRRIAADVHDESIQVLAGVAIRLGLLTSMLERPEQQRLIAGLDESVRRGIKSLRQLLFDLRLPALDELGLAAALRSYLSETLAREGATYTLEDRVEAEPPAELRTVLYRVAQEALSNVRKHANATHVEVTLSGSAAGYNVTVRDDGVGFDIGRQPGEVPGHLGMVGMRERVQAAGGWIDIHSEPGQGTTVEFGVPAADSEPASLAAAREP
jgi:PAS domain S-box-containing protein